jgi:UDP-glucose 4-epimerase
VSTSGMKMLVVGGAGFIGSHLVDRLLAEGHTVDVVDDLTTGSLANLAEARVDAGEGRFKFHNVDAAAGPLRELAAMRRPDVVFHLAALAPGAPAGPAAIATTLAVLDAARDAGAAKVVAALPAAALYGDVSPRDLPLKEDKGFAPATVRGVIARAVADLLDVYRSAYSVEFTALALANVYGPRQRPSDGVVPAFLAAAAGGEAPTFFGDGRQTRDFVFIDDAVDAFVRAAQRGSGLVVNIGTGVQTSIRELWEKVGGTHRAAPITSAARAADVPRCALSSVRARIHLSWEPWTSLDQGLRALNRPR